MTPSDLSGEALDARFFEVCWKSDSAQTSTARLHPREKNQHRHIYVQSGSELILVPPSMQYVSTDANACEAWAMRWARDRSLHWRIDQHNDECRVELWRLDGRWYAYGTDYKQAFVRACVAAAETLQTNGEPK